MKTKIDLSKLERVPLLREAWKYEAGDFTPWLAEADNLDALAQALGLSELEAVATEQYVGDFKLDILCTDGGQRVIIENQLAETDHKHLGQILAYAAGVGAHGNAYTEDQLVEQPAIGLFAQPGRNGGSP
jgi:hypothetical protein